MQAIVMEAFGGPEVLQVRQFDDPIPMAGQVLVSVEYASITFVETQVRAGAGPFGRPALPRIPGNGVGGPIIAVGDDVDPGLVGTVVVTPTGGEGGYAELALARAEDVVPVPPGLDFKDAVALMADGRTALMLFRRAQVAAREYVLVEAAGGGVGSLLVQLASQAGAHVIGAARGTQKADLVIALGGETYVDYGQPDWLDRVTVSTGDRGLDLVFDGVGGRIGKEAVGALRAGGRFCAYGMASGAAVDLDEDDLKANSIRVIGFGGPPTPAENRALIAEALDLAIVGKLRPVIGQVFPLSRASAAHAAIEARATTGKTLLVRDGRAAS